MGLLAWLGAPQLENALLGDSASSPAAAPAGTGGGLLGSPQSDPGAQIPSWQQFNADRSSLGGLLAGILSRGIAPGIGRALEPDSMAAADYNALLQSGSQAGLSGLTYGGYQKMQDR